MRVGGDADHPLGIGQALERAGERRGDAQLDGSADLAGDPDCVRHRRDAVSVLRPMLVVVGI